MSLNTFTTPTGIGQGNSILTQILIVNRQIEENTRGGIEGGGGGGGAATELEAFEQAFLQKQLDGIDQFITKSPARAFAEEMKKGSTAAGNMTRRQKAFFKQAIVEGRLKAEAETKAARTSQSLALKTGKLVGKFFFGPALKFGKALKDVGAAMLNQQLFAGPAQAFFQGFLGRFEIFSELAGAAGEILGNMFNPVMEDAIFNFTSWIVPMEQVAIGMTPLVDGFSAMQTWFGIIGAGITDLINESIEPASKGVQTSGDDFEASLTKVQTDLDEWGVVTETFWTDLLAFFAGETTDFEAEVTGPDGSLPTFEKKGIASIDNFTMESNTALDTWGGTDGTANAKFAAGLANFEATINNFSWTTVAGEIIAGLVQGLIAAVVNLPDLFLEVGQAIGIAIASGVF